MQAVYVQHGGSIDYTPGSDVAAGEVVVQGDIIGIAKVPLSANKQGALAVEGVFDVAKNTGTGTDITVGQILWWDNTNKYVAETDGTGTHKQLGKAVKAATTTDTTVRVRLTQ